VYLNFYKLKDFPFSITSEERFFYPSSIHKEALANMLYTVEQGKGMVLITGEVGAGKTLVGTVLCSELQPVCQPTWMTNPPQKPRELLHAIAASVGMDTHSLETDESLADALQKHLERMFQRGRSVALILDESQDMSDDALQQVRLLWNWEVSGRRVVQIVMIGQPELRERLMNPKWESLRQRIVLSYHLGRLSLKDTAAYILHRLNVAADEGCRVKFTVGAAKDIFMATQGIPRLINVLCDNALLVGYAKGIHRIDRQVISEVLRDMTCWGMQDPGKSNLPSDSASLIR
jgi:general secretion pathway protein A